MQPTDFCYWLQGFVELNGEQPTPEQWRSIKEHLQTVFKKVTPEVSVPNSSSPIIDWGTSPTPYPHPFPYQGTGDRFTPPYEVTCGTDSQLQKDMQELAKDTSVNLEPFKINSIEERPNTPTTYC